LALSCNLRAKRPCNLSKLKKTPFYILVPDFFAQSKNYLPVFPKNLLSQYKGECGISQYEISLYEISQNVGEILHFCEIPAKFSLSQNFLSIFTVHSFYYSIEHFKLKLLHSRKQCCGSRRFLTWSGSGFNFRKYPDSVSDLDPYLNNFRPIFFWKFVWRKYALTIIVMTQKVGKQRF
jgi:hypothetical protein